jgi:hypothetical protein
MNILGLLTLLVVGSVPVLGGPVTSGSPGSDILQSGEKRQVVLAGMGYLKLNRSYEDKYFHEPTGHELGADDMLGHYDSRFFHGLVTDEERVDTLEHMVQAYLNFFRMNDLETWIAHGTLLGWWWNGKVGQYSELI